MNCTHPGAAGPCMPRLSDGCCIWCERDMPNDTGDPMSNLHPYEITFLPSPRARERQTWIRFAPSLMAALEGAKKAAAEEHMDGAHSWMCQEHGQEAEARVHGVLRGGRVFRDRFYFHGPEPRVADLSTVTDLELLDL